MIGSPSNYFIKDGYEVRLDNEYFDDTPFTDEFQRVVYAYARTVADLEGYEKITDVGCGSAFKLAAFFWNFDTVGVDLPPTVKWLKEKYPDRKWQSFDDPAPKESDLVICSDVIEHLPDPDILLSYIKNLKPKHIILSTPERELLNDYNVFNSREGPPKNIHHVREWTLEEFAAYISSRFQIRSHFVVDGWTQILCCGVRENG